MKKCTYCGKEYPDEATSCLVDNQPLEINSRLSADATAPREFKPAAHAKAIWLVFGLAFLFIVAAVIKSLIQNKCLHLVSRLSVGSTASSAGAMHDPHPGHAPTS